MNALILQLMPEKHPGCSSSAMGMQRVHVSSSSWVESACFTAGHVMREGWQIWRPDSWDTDLTRVWLQLQEFHPLTSSDACRRTQLNLPGMVRTKGGGGRHWLAEDGCIRSALNYTSEQMSWFSSYHQRCWRYVKHAYGMSIQSWQILNMPQTRSTSLEELSNIICA